MSVVLLVNHFNSDSESVPVSTQEFFNDSWVPIADRLGLVWIPRFAWGIPLERGDVPLVLAELAKLRQAVSAKELELCEPDRGYMLTRIDLLHEGLQKAMRDESAVDIFVG